MSAINTALLFKANPEGLLNLAESKLPSMEPYPPSPAKVVTTPALVSMNLILGPSLSVT